MAQILTKFITDNAVIDTKERLQSAAYLRSRNNANSGDVNLIRSNASDKVEFPSVPQIASGTPLVAADIITLGYIAQLSVKAPVRAASTTNLTLSAPQTVDGVSLIAGDRVLVAGQTTNTENGIYLVAAGSWTRATDFNSGTNVYEGVETPVAEGTANSGFWQLDSTGGSAVTIGTTALTFKNIGPSNSFTAPTNNKESVTLSGTDITNQYYDLAHTILASSLDLVVGGLIQTEGTDYTVSLTGGAGGVTRISFAGDLATGGPAALVSGDIVNFKYQY